MSEEHIKARLARVEDQVDSAQAWTVDAAGWMASIDEKLDSRKEDIRDLKEAIEKMERLVHARISKQERELKEEMDEIKEDMTFYKRLAVSVSAISAGVGYLLSKLF